MTPPPFEVAAARAVCEAATPGPWIAVQLPARGVGPWRVDAPDIDCIIGDVGEVGTDPCDAGNAQFIAAARSLLPAAIAEVERLRGLLEEACGLLDEVTEDTPKRAHAIRSREIRKATGL